jgi:hypothetical protein
MRDQASAIRRQWSGNITGKTASRTISGLRFYLALVLFINLVGLPILGISSLRHRLQTRVQLLATAMFNDSYGADPIVVGVGESGPFPEEYQTQELGHLDVVPMASIVYMTVERETQPVVDMTMTDTIVPEESDSQPDYSQGELEREAYELLLSSNEKVAAMVKGSDPGLSFQSWAAAPMEGGIFWVNLTFTLVASGLDAQYIWKVDLSSKRVEPLSSNARSITTD